MNLSMNGLKCPICSKDCVCTGETVSCSGHFLMRSIYPKTAMLNNLAYCWEVVDLEDILDTKTEIVFDGSLCYICQERGGYMIEAEGKLCNIIGLFGAFKKLT